ncbi:MAG: hypothetical protein KJ065_12695 [Anaerolineae bacterium]|nr:hypothetical protein [Anaerolineae bacterium]
MGSAYRNFSVLIILILLMLLFNSLGSGHAQNVPLPTPSTPFAGVGEGVSDAVDLTVQAAEGTVSFIQDLLIRLSQPPRSDLARVLLLIGGVLLLVAGWRIYDFVIIVAGAIIGGLVATALVPGDGGLIDIAAFLVGALIGVGLAVVFYYGAVLLIGAYVGIMLVTAFALALGAGGVSDIVVLLGALVGAVIMLSLSFEFLVLLSALVGAQLIVQALGLAPIWLLLLIILGAIIQFALVRAFRYEFRRRRRPLFSRAV